MRKLFNQFGFGAAFLGCMIVVACGDSDDDDSNFAGASGSGGGNTAGDATGGTSAGNGTAGAGRGGMSVGGSAGTPDGSAGETSGGDGNQGGIDGGSAGASAGGSDGTDPGACPANQPKGGSACPIRGLGCDFDDTVCTCGIQTGNWTCQDTRPDCPTTKPTAGMLCGDESGACAYGEAGTCTCPQTGANQGSWTCNGGIVACPAAQPAADSACTGFPENLPCTYSALTCSCEDDAWSCTPCPGAAPDEDGDCANPGLICEYGGGFGGETCVCNDMNAWVCF